MYVYMYIYEGERQLYTDTYVWVRVLVCVCVHIRVSKSSRARVCKRGANRHNSHIDEAINIEAETQLSSYFSCTLVEPAFRSEVIYIVNNSGVEKERTYTHSRIHSFWISLPAEEC